jgi:hypothetical protein
MIELVSGAREFKKNALKNCSINVLLKFIFELFSRDITVFVCARKNHEKSILEI